MACTATHLVVDAIGVSCSDCNSAGKINDAQGVPAEPGQHLSGQIAAGPASHTLQQMGHRVAGASDSQAHLEVNEDVDWLSQAAELDTSDVLAWLEDGPHGACKATLH